MHFSARQHRLSTGVYNTLWNLV